MAVGCGGPSPSKGGARPASGAVARPASLHVNCGRGIVGGPTKPSATAAAEPASGPPSITYLTPSPHEGPLPVGILSVPSSAVSPMIGQRASEPGATIG